MPSLLQHSCDLDIKITLSQCWHCVPSHLSLILRCAPICHHLLAALKAIESIRRSHHLRLSWSDKTQKWHPIWCELPAANGLLFLHFSQIGNYKEARSCRVIGCGTLKARGVRLGGTGHIRQPGALLAWLLPRGARSFHGRMGFWHTGQAAGCCLSQWPAALPTCQLHSVCKISVACQLLR